MVNWERGPVQSHLVIFSNTTLVSLIIRGSCKHSKMLTKDVHRFALKPFTKHCSATFHMKNALKQFFVLAESPC